MASLEEIKENILKAKNVEKASLGVSDVLGQSLLNQSTNFVIKNALALRNNISGSLYDEYRQSQVKSAILKANLYKKNSDDRSFASRENQIISIKPSLTLIDKPTAIKYSTILNTPLYDTLTLGINSKNGWLNIDGETQYYKTVTLENFLISITKRKNIVYSKVQNRKGTVKQFISDDDYDIKVSGYLQDAEKPNSFPIESISEILDVCKCQDNIPVSSLLLYSFGIEKAVITNFEISSEEGVMNTAKFSMDLVSDDDLDLEIIGI